MTNVFWLVPTGFDGWVIVRCIVLVSVAAVNHHPLDAFDRPLETAFQSQGPLENEFAF